MKIVFIRHGEADYIPCYERNFIGHGLDLAPLTDIGIQQAEEVALHDELKDCGIIVSSPYTRALQTASIISGKTGIKIAVEVDLHEWKPDKTYQYKTSEQLFEIRKDFFKCKGSFPEGELHNWETIEEIIQRVVPVLDKYLQLEFSQIAVVAHGGIIRRFKDDCNVQHCTPYMVDYSKDFKCVHWAD